MKKKYSKIVFLFFLSFTGLKMISQENQVVQIVGKLNSNFISNSNNNSKAKKNTSRLLASTISPLAQTLCSGEAVTSITSSGPAINGATKLDCVTGGAPTLITNANNGIYFDITNSGAVPARISGFDIFTYVGGAATTSTINQGYTFYKTTTATTAVGNYNTAANWTNLGSVSYALPATALNSGYILPIALNDTGFTLAPGASVGFYIVCNNTTTTGWKLGYRNTATTGSPIADSNITVTHRSRGDGLFNGGVTLRGFYGNVYYHTGTYGFWTRNNTTNITGTTTAGDSYSGVTPFPISGSLTNSTSSTQTATYTITSYDVNGVKDIQTATITVNPTPANTVTLVGNTLTADQVGATYQWFDCNNANAPITGETNQSFTVTVDGNYGVTVTLNSCPINSACNAVLSSTEFEASNLFQLFPNPSSTHFNINSQYDFTFKMINNLGQVVKTFDYVSGVETQVSTSNLSKGLYFLTGTSSEGKTVTKKIIIE